MKNSIKVVYSPEALNEVQIETNGKDIEVALDNIRLYSDGDDDCFLVEMHHDSNNIERFTITTDEIKALIMVLMVAKGLVHK